jgi:hypothetical protein
MKRLIAMIAMTVSGLAMAQEAAVKVGDVGSWAEVRARPNPSGFCIVPIPALSAILAAKEREKGGPLAEAEVLLIRDQAAVMVLPDKGEPLVERRGYKDIDPEHAWQEWQVVRAQVQQ